MRRLALALVLLPFPIALGAQEFELTVPNIMMGPEHVGEPPELVRWTDDGQWIYFRWKPGGTPWSEEPAFHRVLARGGAPEKVDDAHMDSVGVFLASGDLSADRRRKVVSHDGDLWLIDRRRNHARRLTDTRTPERNPTFSEDARTVYFTRGDNVFALGLESGELRQLTDVRKGPEPEEREAEGARRALEEQQLELFEHVRRQAERREEREERRKAREARDPKPIRIDRDENVTGIMVSPTERWALIQVTRPAGQAQQTMVPDYVTASGYTEPLDVRTKVGDWQSSARVGRIQIDTGDILWLDLAPDARDVAGEDADVAGEAEDGAAEDGAAEDGADADVAAEAADSAAAPRARRPALANVSFRGWNRDGTLGLISATSYDFKNRWLHVVDAATGDIRTVSHDHDPAWVGGPCGFCVGWKPDGRDIWFVSERDGYAHLYTVAAAGGAARQLTAGPWEVHAAEISADERRFWLRTNDGSPFEYHFYHMPLAGGERVRVTSAPGVHNATPSPDGGRLAVVHSYSNRPPELYVMQNRRGAGMTRVTHSPTAAWESFPWIDPDIIHFAARDGAQVPARIYRPRDLGAPANGAAVIFVHGAGYLQNVHRGWSRYYREYMFHHLLASRGFTVLDIDFRASQGYGRDWRTAIYRHMGDKDLSDQVDGARYLVEAEGVDPGRIGIYGGSYGGFITLMALFTQPETFAAGAALRAVTDWAHYNHPYTSRILNLPHEDDESYRRSSPIYFAEGLRAPLLITHGMVDVNVHFQDVVRLAQRLIELGKTDWELAVYPVEDHAFVAPSSWTDQYRRIYELFERHLAPFVTSVEAHVD
jgi:dipeptidyl aminopeptidase/acylaminoacyl peptidase